MGWFSRHSGLIFFMAFMLLVGILCFIGWEFVQAFREGLQERQNRAEFGDAVRIPVEVISIRTGERLA